MKDLGDSQLGFQQTSRRKLTMQVSLVFATALLSPTERRIADMALQPGAPELSVIRTAAMRPQAVPPMAIARIAVLRGVLELLTVQRMKFGWAWYRRNMSTVPTICLKADGCVVFAKAWIRASRSLADRFSWRDPPSLI